MGVCVIVFVLLIIVMDVWWNDLVVCVVYCGVLCCFVVLVCVVLCWLFCSNVCCLIEENDDVIVYFCVSLGCWDVYDINFDFFDGIIISIYMYLYVYFDWCVLNGIVLCVGVCVSVCVVCWCLCVCLIWCGVCGLVLCGVCVCGWLSMCYMVMGCWVCMMGFVDCGWSIVCDWWWWWVFRGYMIFKVCVCLKILIVWCERWYWSVRWWRARLRRRRRARRASGRWMRYLMRFVELWMLWRCVVICIFCVNMLLWWRRCMCDYKIML